MKTCSQCNLYLPLESFDIQSTGKLGRRADCKECKRRFVRSKRGLIKQIYNQQKCKSKERGYQPPKYTEIELFNWANKNPEFHMLFEAWVESEYQSRFRPSCDRINDYITYALDNIQFTTWNENNQKGYADHSNGNNTKHNKAVDMLDMKGEFIKRFHSVSEAARQFNGIPSNIIGAITKRSTTRINPDGSTRTYTKNSAYGHLWRYALVPNDNSEIT